VDYRYSKILGVVFPSVYSAILAIVCLVNNVLPTPEFVVLAFFIYATYNKMTRRFLGDWGPYILIFLSFEALFGIVGGSAGLLQKAVAGANQLLALETSLFGCIPTLALQQLCRTPFLDYMGAFFYSLHFLAPTLFAFILWKYSPQNFRKYTAVLAIGIYSALVTFLVYPTAPPWQAVGGVQRILFSVDTRIGIPFYKTIFDYVSSDPYAAFPSLHAMLPSIVLLYSLKIKKLRALPVLIYPVGVWFSAVYLGEHYVVDIIGGVLYAVLAFILVEKAAPIIAERISSRPKPQNGPADKRL